MSAIVVPFNVNGKEAIQSDSSQFLGSYFDPSYGIQWNILQPDAPRRITPQLLDEILTLQQEFVAGFNSNPEVKYQIFGSEIPGVFSLGGDLKFFANCARTRNEAALRKYGNEAIEVSYKRATNFNLPITTISLVKGVALGGGFEAALAANYLIAEQQATFSFPETRFGLFPAHGAFTFLRQRLPVRKAEEIIYSGKTYTAEELHEMGVVDIVCENGEGDAATTQFIRKRHQQHQGIHAMREMVQKFAPIDREELYSIVDHWVDSVMNLNEKQLRMIEALAKTSENFLK